MTVAAVLHSVALSTKAENSFIVLGDIISGSSVGTYWGSTFVLLEAFLTYIIKFGKGVRPCIVSMNTMLFLKKCKIVIGFVNFFITTKCSTSVLSPVSNLSLAAANGFSNWNSPLVFEN